MDFIFETMNALASISVSGGIYNYGISEFLGCFFFLPIIPFLLFAVMDGLGVFRDQFAVSHRKPR